ncbi:hypothetical protein [Arthrobacter sp. TMN-50]
MTEWAAVLAADGDQAVQGTRGALELLGGLRRTAQHEARSNLA